MIKRKTDYVYTTTDGREHTDRNIAKKEELNVSCDEGVFAFIY